MTEDGNKQTYTTRLKPSVIQMLHELSNEMETPMAQIIEKLVEEKHYNCVKAQTDFFNEGMFAMPSTEEK